MSENRLYAQGWSDYELIDAGAEKKLERWGGIITIRPEKQAYFKSGLQLNEWREMAHFEFVPDDKKSGHWQALKMGTPKEWTIHYDKFTFQLKLTKFKHLGLFPEQQVNWDFIHKQLFQDQRFLNLFAYTGAASSFSRSLGAETIHVDSVKQLISWAKQNMELNHLDGIKWVHDDALKFIERESRRKNLYDGIIMDPPAWGIGAKNEKWKLEDQFEELMKTASSLLKKEGFLILNTYSPSVEIGTVIQLTSRYFINKKTEVKELWMKTKTGKDLYFGNLLRANGEVE